MVDLMSVRFSDPVAVKKSPNQPSITVFESWYDVFVLIRSVCFLPNVVLCITAKHLCFLLCAKDII